MDKGRKKCFNEHIEPSPISIIKIAQEDMWKTKILGVETASSNIDTALFKLSIAAVESPEYLLKVIRESNSGCAKSDSIMSPVTPKISFPATSKICSPPTSKIISPATPKIISPATPKISFPEASKINFPEASKINFPETSKISFPETSKISSSATSKLRSPKILMDLTKPMFGIEELLESINLQTEEIEEMLDMISQAKEKLEFFISHVECLVKSLQKVPKLPPTDRGRGNTYVKNMYRKKLEEFATGLLGNVKKSIEGLEIEYGVLKEQEYKIAETCKKN